MAKKRRKSRLCANCNYRFEGIDNYCPNCGQENHSHHAPFKHLFLELIEGVTHFDTKFFSTTKALFLRPGLLTKDYIMDRRARYVPPLRLYIFTSFLFFFCMSLISDDNEYKLSETRPDARDTTGRISFSFGQSGINIGDKTAGKEYAKELIGRERVTTEQIDSLVESKEKDAGWLRRRILRQNIKAALGLISEKLLLSTMFKNCGIALFILMPVFALLLKLAYIRRKRLYIEHLIFSVHFHCFLFALLLVTTLLTETTGEDIWIVLAALGMPVYGVLAMHRVYEGSWIMTTVKALFLTMFYSVFLSLGLAAAVFLSFLLL